eukprot:GEMP01012326.1.p1 GENE.GEMP01012326.1~~GEMP01012326.1.p1  ORF type:complete len:329 (+),score=30.13 GEMP01012326.1:120-1106(+)
MAYIDDKEHGKFVAFKRLCRKYCALDPCLDRIFDGFDCIMKCLGPILVCVGVALIAFISYVVVFIWLPRQETSSRLLLTPMAGWLYFNIMYNYMRAIWADAGKPGEYVEEMEKQDLEMVDSDDEYDYMVAKQKTPNAKMRQCGKCTLQKPIRAHHCSVCNRCTLKMDHHCPWINNCVGWNNYRNFCLFMLYLFIGCIFVVVNFFPEFVLSWTRRSGHSHFERSERRNIHLAFVIAGSVIISLSILGGFHAFLVLTNQTTIEFQQNWISRKMARQSGNMFRNPYDLGRTRNFQQVFGQIRFWTFKWMLPIEPAKLGDGATWPSLFHQHI